MNILITGVLCAALWAASDSPLKTKTPKPQAGANGEQKSPADVEYEKLIEQDEVALKEVEKMNADHAAFAQQGVAETAAVLAAKIEQRLEPVRKAYEDFLLKYPSHVDGRLAYGSFLNELGEEEASIVHWEKARELDPKNPSPWNNLANVYAHIGPIKKAFQYYERAIELDAAEAVYVQNLATVTYLFRKDAAETYRIDEAGVFKKALDLYQRAMKLDPTNIVLATDYAQSFYGIQPLRAEEAISAWRHALTLAKSDAEREGIYLHLARVELNSGRFTEAEQHLALVSNPEMQELKERLRKNLERKRADAEAGAKKTDKENDKAAAQGQSQQGLTTSK